MIKQKSNIVIAAVNINPKYSWYGKLLHYSLYFKVYIFIPKT